MEITDAIKLVHLDLDFTYRVCRYILEELSSGVVPLTMMPLTILKCDTILDAGVFKTEYFKTKLSNEYIDNGLHINIEHEIIERCKMLQFYNEYEDVDSYDYVVKSDIIETDICGKFDRIYSLLDEFNNEPNKYQIQLLDKNFAWYVLLYYLAYNKKKYLLKKQ